jgi:hypothetical protein
MRRSTGDKGQASPLLALLVVVAVVAALVVSELGATVTDRARARTAADAAALAGVAGGRVAAEAMAAADHGSLERFVVANGDTDVTVRVGRAQATARARAGGSLIKWPD